MRSRLALWLWARRHRGRRVEWHSNGRSTITSEHGMVLELNRLTRGETAAVALDAIREYERLITKVADAMRREETEAR